MKESMSEVRPAHFPPGTPIGKYYLVEGLVRLSERRMFYLVHDDRRDGSHRRCWSCGTDRISVRRTRCPVCGGSLQPRRFLMTSRWHRADIEHYQSFYDKKLEHPGLAGPCDVIRLDDQLLTFHPYAGEGLMVDEASPLPNFRVLYLAQRIVGVVMFLARHGVRVGNLTRAQLLISPDGGVRLFDLDVVGLEDRPLDPHELTEVMHALGAMLLPYCHVRSRALVDFFGLVVQGDFTTPAAFGRAIESRFDAYSALAYPPTLGAMSDVGLSRALNEDTWGWTTLGPNSELFVVADGMGGHEGGEVASALAVETMCSLSRRKAPMLLDQDGALEVMLDEVFRKANKAVKLEGERRGNDMGTTMVAALMHEGRHALVANVGDSRAYLFRGRTLHQVSVDHSYVQKLVERGQIRPEEARHHPQSNILVRTVGTERDVEVDIFRVELEPGDRLLLCTDGLWGEVEDEDMASILVAYSDPRVAVRELVRAAHQGGGRDNVTLMVIAVR